MKVRKKTGGDLTAITKRNQPLDLDWDELADLRWFCRDCGQLRAHPYRKEGDNRFHSNHCKTPMIRVLVTIKQVNPKARKSQIDALMGVK